MARDGKDLVGIAKRTAALAGWLAVVLFFFLQSG